jgi:hypothetical protein
MLLSSDAIRAAFMVCEFKVTRRCPYWVGKAAVVANALPWVDGVDAAAVYRLHDGRYVAVVGRRSGRRTRWATADLTITS